MARRVLQRDQLVAHAVADRCLLTVASSFHHIRV
jgi:hypothetical protein